MSGSDVVGEYGTLERSGDVSILRYERRLAHTPHKVWRAHHRGRRLGNVVPDDHGGGTARRRSAAFLVPPG
jgi:hypothetical protein